MKSSKLLNSLIFQLLLTIVFSIQLMAAESINIWKGNSEIKIESAESNQINPDDKKIHYLKKDKLLKLIFFRRKTKI